MSDHDWDNLPDENLHGLKHNPGYDFLRMIDYLGKCDPKDPALPFPPYFLPVFTAIMACCGVEGYINMIGGRLDAKWVKNNARSDVRTKLTRLYRRIGKTPDFSSGCYHDVLQLFRLRNKLVHPKYIHSIVKGRSTVQDIFTRLSDEFPVQRIEGVAKAVKQQLLSDFGVSDCWWTRSLNLEVF